MHSLVVEHSILTYIQGPLGVVQPREVAPFWRRIRRWRLESHAIVAEQEAEEAGGVPTTAFLPRWRRVYPWRHEASELLAEQEAEEASDEED